ncbi:MAG: AbrB/MazE/SpoVT family DNA-binding domain-containing protein, partial [Betaproteobacteria bacterium]
LRSGDATEASPLREVGVVVKSRMGRRWAHRIDDAGQCRYSNYMKRESLPTPPKLPEKVELKVVRIGNSRGVRLPKAVLERYEIKDALVLEAREEGLLLRGKKDKRLTWEETYRAAAREKEDWSDLDATLADGIDPAEKW